MRKLIAFILIISSLILNFSGCILKEPDAVSLGISYDNATLVKEYDNHQGGFGDGITYNEYSFRECPVTDKVLSDSHWHKFPVSENVTAIFYGSDNRAPYVTRENDDKPLTPKVENGYYFFYDRHSESKNTADDTDVFSRVSVDFTVAIYDTDKNILYYCEYDT